MAGVFRFSPKIRKGRNRRKTVTSATTATMRMLCSLSMALLLSPHPDQNGSDGSHRGDQKHILAEKDQAHGGGGETHQGRPVVLAAEPLLHKDGDEKGRQNELDALKVQGQQTPGKAPQHAAQHPVDLIEKGNQEAVTQLRGLFLGYQGVGLVRQRKDQVRLLFSGPLVGLHHGDPVKQMPGVHHQGSQGRGKQPRSTGEKADRHILHGPGINKQAHAKAPDKPIAALVQQNTKPKPKKHIPGHHRQRIQEGSTDGRMLHRGSLSFRKMQTIKFQFAGMDRRTIRYGPWPRFCAF